MKRNSIECCINCLTIRAHRPSVIEIVRDVWSRELGWGDLGKILSYFGYSPIQCFPEVSNIWYNQDKKYERSVGDIARPKRVQMPYGMARICTPREPAIEFNIYDWSLALTQFLNHNNDFLNSPEFLSKMMSDAVLDEITDNYAAQCNWMAYMLYSAYKVYIENTELAEHPEARIHHRTIQKCKLLYDIITGSPEILEGLTLGAYDFRLATGILNSTFTKLQEQKGKVNVPSAV